MWAGKIHGKKNGAQDLSDRVCPGGASGGALWEVQIQRKGVCTYGRSLNGERMKGES